MQDPHPRITQSIATEINARPAQVASAIALLDAGATVPFVARYRKEATGGLDDTQLRLLADRLGYLRELEARRNVIVESIRTQGKLTESLARDIAEAETKAALEDIYLPYKPKRRTKAMIARENGLEPLLQAILNTRDVQPEALAEAYLTANITTVKAALDGARDILAEDLSERATLLGRLRTYLRANAIIRAKVLPGKESQGAKFSDYFDHSEAWAQIPSHRALAILRAAKEEVVTIDIGPDPETGLARVQDMVAAEIGGLGRAAGDAWLRKCAEWTWRVKLSLSMYSDLMSELRQRAHEDAITVFSRNLKDLLLAAPAGPRPTLGLDPGIRTGVKMAVVDATGKLLETETLYPFAPRNDLRGAQSRLLDAIRRHSVELVAIGNGTASRETQAMVLAALKELPRDIVHPTAVIVSEAGASIYSASELAAREFPDLDVSLRGVVSIARRLQDPLAELVKIAPQSIGVGQYQHDVDQRRLTQALDGVVEDAVNAVGVELNIASAPLLARVAGLSASLAQSVVAHRDAQGPFSNRRALLKVAGLGPKAFEQCAGFLRIRESSEPLDSTAVHPEAYDVARRIVSASGCDIRALMKDPSPLRRLRPEDFVDTDFGLPTIRDIFEELEKPGRDPRPSFVTARFAEGVDDIRDLKPGMTLEGTVTNVAAFGAFVDIGVHQDGLVHVSQLADRFVKDPHSVVKAGDVVKVRVTEVDVARKRIGLSMRKHDGASTPSQAHRAPRGQGGKGATGRSSAKQEESSGQGALGAALQQAMIKKR
ncbi:MAG: Tex family protein [Roseinatronobacter sp.]